eukprot:3867067-Amphidinium_carterae.1
MAKAPADVSVWLVSCAGGAGRPDPSVRGSLCFSCPRAHSRVSYNPDRWHKSHAQPHADAAQPCSGRIRNFGPTNWGGKVSCKFVQFN